MGLGIPELLQGLKGQGPLRCLPERSRRACMIPGRGRPRPGCMRYPDGGGLTAAGSAREKVRLQATAMFGRLGLSTVLARPDSASNLNHR